MKFITLLVAAAFIATASVAQTGQPKQAQSQSMPAANQSAAKGEKHPNIVDAQKELEKAKEHLQKAPHDFGGHRTKAMESINIALSELKEALQWAEQHPNEPKK